MLHNYPQKHGEVGEDLVVQLNGGRLPLNIQCNNSLSYMGICVSVGKRRFKVYHKNIEKMLVMTFV